MLPVVFHRMPRLTRARARRGVALFLLIFETLFLNVVVPGHTRGIITMSGPTGRVTLADIGCPMCRAAAEANAADADAAPGDAGAGNAARADSTSGKAHHAPTRKEQSDCAICNLAVRLMATRCVIWTPVLLPTIERAPLPEHVAPKILALPLYDSRGPPHSLA